MEKEECCGGEDNFKIESPSFLRIKKEGRVKRKVHNMVVHFFVFYGKE